MQWNRTFYKWMHFCTNCYSKKSFILSVPGRWHPLIRGSTRTASDCRPELFRSRSWSDLSCSDRLATCPSAERPTPAETFRCTGSSTSLRTWRLADLAADAASVPDILNRNLPHWQISDWERHFRKRSALQERLRRTRSRSTSCCYCSRWSSALPLFIFFSKPQVSFKR